MRRILILIAAVTLVGLFAVPALAGDGYDQTIDAKALSDHECDSSEWHFVITQVVDEAHAPDSIEVTFSGGDTIQVALDKFTGGTAHYTEVSHLAETVVSATASIYASWSGQFNLSHGPCGEEPPSPPEFSVIPPAPACEPWQPSWTLVVPEFEGTLYAFFDEGFALELESGVDVVIETEQPIEGPTFFGVVVEDDEGNVIFSYSDSIEPQTEGCEETTTTTTQPTTTTSEPKVEDTSTTITPTTVAPTPTSTAPAPDGGDEGAFPVVPVALGATLLLASLIGLATRQQEQ